MKKKKRPVSVNLRGVKRGNKASPPPPTHTHKKKGLCLPPHPPTPPTSRSPPGEVSSPPCTIPKRFCSVGRRCACGIGGVVVVVV